MAQEASAEGTRIGAVRADGMVALRIFFFFFLAWSSQGELGENGGYF